MTDAAVIERSDRHRPDTAPVAEVPQSPWRIELRPALVAFGAVLGTLAYKTGRLGPGIIAHMAFNAVTVIALLLSA